MRVLHLDLAPDVTLNVNVDVGTGFTYQLAIADAESGVNAEYPCTVDDARLLVSLNWSSPSGKPDAPRFAGWIPDPLRR